MRYINAALPFALTGQKRQQPTFGGDITLARGDVILGIKLNDLRDLAKLWGN